MAGRRALGQILAELRDAGRLGLSWPAHSLHLVDDKLVKLEVQALDSSTPMPWRSAGTASYDITGWCAEAEQASSAYAEAVAGSPDFVLAESSEWKCLEWGLPEEWRKTRTSHAPEIVAGVTMPVKPTWEESAAGASSYPQLTDVDWSNLELVVHGREHGSDSRWIDWIALHPAVADELGWHPIADVPFAWEGLDGVWRARSVRRVQGQLSHQPPASTAVAEVWQVVVSQAGLADIVSRFGPLRRSVRVRRRLPPGPRDGRPTDSSGVATAIVQPTGS